MHALTPIRLELLIYLPAAALMLALLAWRGCFHPDVLHRGPQRDTGLTGGDLFLGLALMVAGMTVYALLSQAGWISGPPDEATGTGPTLIDTARRMLAAQALMHLPVVLFTLWRAAGKPRGVGELGVSLRHPWRDVGYAVGALVVVLVLCQGVNTLTVALTLLTTGQWPPRIGHEMLNQITLAAERRQLVALGLLLGSALIAAPVLEEVIFRGLAQTSLRELLGRERRWSAVLIASVVFTLVHVSGGIQWQSLPGLFVVGLTLGWLYERTGSLTAPMLTHVGFNAVNTALALGMGR